MELFPSSSQDSRFCTLNDESVWSAATWSGQYDEDAAWATGSPGIPPGHLIVDSAAGQALIGEAACVKWEQKLSSVGLCGVRVHCKMMTPKGVGGTAHPTRSMMMPTMIDGLPGVLQYTVVEEDIPGLLPLGFQEKQGAMINLRTNKLHLPHLRAVVPVHRTQGRAPHDGCDDGTDASHFPPYQEKCCIDFGCLGISLWWEVQLRTQFEMAMTNS